MPTDNLTLSSTAPAGPPDTTKIGAREVSYSGELVKMGAGGIVLFEGAEDAKTVKDVSIDAPLPVKHVRSDVFRCSFADQLTGAVSSDLNLMQVGSGMAVNQTNGSLVITTGTTANAQSLIRSNRVFNGPHIFRGRVILSQRIANQNFEFAMADLVGEGLAFTINSATSVTVTFPVVNPFTAVLNVGQGVNIGEISGAAGVPMRATIASVSALTVTLTVAGWPASGSGTCTLWGWHYHRLLFNGTVNTNAGYDTQRKGWNSTDITATTNSTATGTIFHLQSLTNHAFLADATAASAIVPQFTARASRIENIPDDGVDLYIFVNVYNGTTAPASTTTLTCGFIHGEETGRQKVIVTGGDQTGAGAATSVSVLSLPALPTGTNSIGSITTIVPGTAATNLGKAEDAAHTSGDVGVMSLGVRTDTLASLNGATGRYHPFLIDSLGRMYTTAQVKNAWLTRTAVTITLASLAAGAGQQSTVIDVEALGAMDILWSFRGRLSGAGTTPCPIYVYASMGDAVYTDGCTGSNAAFTAANRVHMPLAGYWTPAGAVEQTTNTEALARLFGGTLPPRIGFVIVNPATNAAFDATAGNFTMQYRPVTR